MKASSLQQSQILVSLPLVGLGAINILQAFFNIKFDYFILPGSASLWFVLSGLFLLAFAVAVITRKKAKIIALLVALVMTFFVAVVYVPNLGSDVFSTKFVSILNMCKDLILAAGALTYAGLVSAKM
ncbi:MAG: hypothetical protein IT223_11115 [Crocinitomicaceae bacterium]|nr:hypothetical protein [Crocinitomicaceae bacterium]